MAKGENVKILEFEGKRITFDFGDGQQMVNATQMVKAFDKRLNNFMRLKQTKEFIEMLKSVDSHVSQREIIRVVKGGAPEQQGTWVNDILALKIAAWLSPRFELWMYLKIKELLTIGKVELEPKNEIEDKELLFYLNKILENSLESNRFAEYLIERKTGKLLPPEK